MHLHINTTSQLSGTMTPPSSKSQNIRGVLFSALSSGESILYNPLTSNDTSDVIKIVQALGVTVKWAKDVSPLRNKNINAVIEKKMEPGHDHMMLSSGGIPFQTNTTDYYSGNSGLTTLFSLPLLGFREHNDIPVTFDCGEQMRARPVAPLVDALNQLGMEINYLKEKDKCPLSVSGSLQGGKTTVDGLNSQYLSALLISLPCAPNDSEISVIDLHERPYVEMTLNWLDKQGITYTHNRLNNKDIFTIPGKQTYSAFESHIPVDFSSASCLIAAATLIPGEVTFEGLDMNEAQSDKALIPLLQKMGGDLVIKDDKLLIKGGKKLTGIEIDANDFPDLIPALSIIATQATGKTRIYNVAHARIKETDRIESMAEGLKAMGARIETFEDGMTIWQSALTGCHVKGFGDHRTVMSLSVAGLLATGETIIDDAEAIAKTFPDFAEVMRSLGAKIQKNTP